MTTTPDDALVEQVRDELAGYTIGSGYYTTAVGVDEAAEMARTLAPLIAARERKAAKEALRIAAGTATDHAMMCPTGCRTSACAGHNRTTAAWLRDFADAYPEEPTP